MARVLRRNGDNYAQPIVRIVQDADGQAVPEDSEAAIVDLAADGLDVVQALAARRAARIGLTEEILWMGTRLASSPKPNERI